MNIVQIDNWMDYARDGEQFLKTAVEAHRKKKKAFSEDTLYNLTCMAIEKLVMAYLMKNGDLAENHTVGDLVHALDRHISLSGELRDNLMFLDTFQEICDLDEYTIKSPSQAEIRRIISTGQMLRSVLGPLLGINEGRAYAISH